MVSSIHKNSTARRAFTSSYRLCSFCSFSASAIGGCQYQCGACGTCATKYPNFTCFCRVPGFHLNTKDTSNHIHYPQCGRIGNSEHRESRFPFEYTHCTHRLSRIEEHSNADEHTPGYSLESRNDIGRAVACSWTGEPCYERNSKCY